MGQSHFVYTALVVMSLRLNVRALFVLKSCIFHKTIIKQSGIMFSGIYVKGNVAVYNG